MGRRGAGEEVGLGGGGRGGVHVIWFPLHQNKKKPSYPRKH